MSDPSKGDEEGNAGYYREQCDAQHYLSHGL